MDPGQGDSGPSPIRSFTAFRKALLAAKIALSGLHRHVSKQDLNLFEFTSGLMAEAGTRPAEVVGSNRSEAAVGSSFPDFGPDHLWSEPGPPTLPTLLTERKKTPFCRPAEAIQESTADLTQSGTGTVRKWPPFPTKSAKTQ